MKIYLFIVPKIFIFPLIFVIPVQGLDQVVRRDERRDPGGGARQGRLQHHGAHRPPRPAPLRDRGAGGQLQLPGPGRRHPAPAGALCQ